MLNKNNTMRKSSSSCCGIAILLSILGIFVLISSTFMITNGGIVPLWLWLIKTF